MQKARDAEARARAMIAKVKPALRVKLGKRNPLLQSQFGIAPSKEPKRTATVKAAAAAKARATRAALGTKGARQKRVAKKAIGAQAKS